MENNILTDKEISSFFEKDAKNITPDVAVSERLEYAFMVKSRNYKTMQNSFLGIFAWLFSWSQWPVKAVMASGILLLSIFNIKIIDNQNMFPAQDTTFNMFQQNIDSSGMSPFFADTCLTSKALTKKKEESIKNSPCNNFHTFEIICPASSIYNRNSFAESVLFSFHHHPILRQHQLADSDNKDYSEFRFLT